MSIHMHSTHAEAHADGRDAVLALLRDTAQQCADHPETDAIEALLSCGTEAVRVLAERGAREMLAEHRSAKRMQLERQARRDVRERFTLPPQAAAAAVARADYYGWPLPVSGVRLGDADEKALAAAAEYHRQAAAGEQKRAAQYDALAARLRASGARLVREGLTAAEVAAIIAEAGNAA